MDFKVEKSLRQVEPVSPFSLLMVAEGLAALMKNASNLREFKGFRLSDNMKFDLL